MLCLLDTTTSQISYQHNFGTSNGTGTQLHHRFPTLSPDHPWHIQLWSRKKKMDLPRKNLQINALPLRHVLCQSEHPQLTWLPLPLWNPWWLPQIILNSSYRIIWIARVKPLAPWLSLRYGKTYSVSCLSTDGNGSSW